MTPAALNQDWTHTTDFMKQHANLDTSLNFQGRNLSEHHHYEKIYSIYFKSFLSILMSDGVVEKDNNNQGRGEKTTRKSQIHDSNNFNKVTLFLSRSCDIHDNLWKWSSVPSLNRYHVFYILFAHFDRIYCARVALEVRSVKLRIDSN